MSTAIVLSGARWFSVKWWAVNTVNVRDDLAERAALSVESLRKAGFLARIGERTNESFARFAAEHPQYRPNSYITLIRVEVYGDSEAHERARSHLRGFWAALESRGMPKDYRIGYSTGVAVLQSFASEKPRQLPTPRVKRLRA